MQPITHISGKTIPLARNDVDTDLIIPAQYLTSVSKDGYGKHLFIRLRQSDPTFVFNQAEFSDATILISQENFGCGSSREHAVWALQEAGIQAIIAVSFADIFFNNSAKNGLLLIQLPEENIMRMLDQAQNGDYCLTIDINEQTIFSNYQDNFTFDIDPFRKHCLTQGLDDLDYLRNCHKQINQHAMQHAAMRFLSPPTGEIV